ncbi:MAG TPA: ABC transporter permease subunit [bacterium]|nr:ABC transporter permease subunit [bacterium]
MNALLTIAAKEVADHLRNGWVLTVSVAFALFAVIIALAGYAFTGQVGVGGGDQTLVSLISLTIYLVPLLGLLLGYDAIAGESERGTLDLLLSCPLTAVQLLLGKWLGLVTVLGAVVVLGLAVPAGLAIAHGAALVPWVGFLASNVWLGAIFVGLAILLSTVPLERGTLVGLALAVWLTLVILFDLGLIGLLVATGGQVPTVVVNALFLLNPTSLFRFLTLETLVGGGVLSQLGLGAQAPSLAALLGALLAWSVLPLALGGHRLLRNR